MSYHFRIYSDVGDDDFRITIYGSLLMIFSGILVISSLVRVVERAR